MSTNNTYNGKKNTLIRYTLLLLCIILYIPDLPADETTGITETTVSFETEDIELTASCYLTGSESILVFLPSVYAPLEEQEVFAQEIASKNLSACFSHVFTDMFLPMERRYYQDIPLPAMLALLTNIQQASQKSVFFVAHGTGNRVAYRLAHLALQTDNQSNSVPSGLILLSPNLLDATPAAGKEQQYLSIIHQKSLPVFIFQAAYSPHHWHLDALIQQIEKSGTLVLYRRLPGVRDGYALRQDRNKQEQELRGQAAVLFSRAIQQLSETR